MSLLYRAMYAIGFAPWDTGEISEPLREIAAGTNALTPGRALDIGCGTGTQAAYLADLGWNVTAIDVVDKPLRKARARASAESVEFLNADITRPDEVPHTGEHDLVHDRGCFHGLRHAQRAGYVQAVTRLARPGGSLLLMAFARNRVPGGPDGADPAEIAELFSPGWRIVATVPDTDAAPAGPMRDVPRFWHRLTRTEPT